jgi:hypothetical protein
MLPQDVLEAVDRMEGMTSGNKKWVIYRGKALMEVVFSMCVHRIRQGTKRRQQFGTAYRKCTMVPCL